VKRFKERVILAERFSLSKVLEDFRVLGGID
jgi:hypothetical protein